MLLTVGTGRANARGRRIGRIYRVYDIPKDWALRPFGHDLWNDVYCPCLYLRPDEAEALLLDVENWALPGRLGDSLALSARAWMRLGRPDEAWRAFERAQRAGGPEVDLLESVVLPGAVERCTRRAEAAAHPGAAAEAWLDAASVHLDRGDLPLARRAIDAAVEACGDHAEAGHFKRLMAEPAIQRGWQRAEFLSRTPLSRGLALADARRLRPLRRNGWVSEERLERRCWFVANDAEVPRGTGLAALRSAGWFGFFLATDLDYTTVPPDHPLPKLEVECGQISAHVNEGRAAGPRAATLWAAVSGDADDQTTDDVAQLLCALATRDPSMLAAGRLAAGWLLGHDPAHQALWHAYVGWLGALAGDARDEALAHAGTVLALPRPGALAWRLAVATLARCGERDAALRAVHARRDDTDCGFTARHLAAPGADLCDASVTCSPRLVPRRLAPPRRPAASPAVAVD